MDMIGPIKGKLLEILLFRINIDKTDIEPLKKFRLGTLCSEVIWT